MKNFHVLTYVSVAQFEDNVCELSKVLDRDAFRAITTISVPEDSVTVKGDKLELTTEGCEIYSRLAVEDKFANLSVIDNRITPKSGIIKAVDLLGNKYLLSADHRVCPTNESSQFLVLTENTQQGRVFLTDVFTAVGDEIGSVDSLTPDSMLDMARKKLAGCLRLNRKVGDDVAQQLAELVVRGLEESDAFDVEKGNSRVGSFNLNIDDRNFSLNYVTIRRNKE